MTRIFETIVAPITCFPNLTCFSDQRVYMLHRKTYVMQRKQVSSQNRFLALNLLFESTIEPDCWDGNMMEKPIKVESRWHKQGQKDMTVWRLEDGQ